MRMQSFLVFAALCITLFACSPTAPEKVKVSTPGYLVLIVKYSEASNFLGKDAKSQTLTEVHCRITQDTTTVIKQKLEKLGDSFQGQFQLRAAENYSVQLSGIEKDTLIYFGSKKGIRITAGQTTTEQIDFTSIIIELMSPQNDTIPDVKPAFAWKFEGIDRPTYHIQLAKDAIFLTIIKNDSSLKTNSYADVDSLNNGTYYWRVRVGDWTGKWSRWTEKRTFAIYDLLPAPILSRPRHNSINADEGGIEFAWGVVTGAIEYQLQYGYSKSNFFGNVFTEWAFEDTHAFTGKDVRVYWRVRAKNKDGIWGKWSDIGQFVVRGTKWTRVSWINSGAFTMGSNEASDEMPIHTVHLDLYLMNMSETPNGDYAQFLNYLLDDGLIQIFANEVRLQDTLLCRLEDMEYSAGSFSVPSDKAYMPVHSVTWFGANRYAKFFGKRLPTEAEWEKAGRGTDGRRYPWGNEAPDNSRCNFNSLFGNYVPVTLLSPEGDSPSGCHNMAGNVTEWCSDWYSADYYKNPSALNNPTGPASGTEKVARGGNYRDIATDVRCAKRFHYPPDYAGNGFRCASWP